ncbi:MAG TPA: hypothetical protein VMZ03_00335 [Chitinophagaceae bacterium]|nr:hypothetical protein [Chitinophagaceae bacterium]
MKKIFVLGILAAGLVATSCSRTKGAYLDLRSGERVEVEKDPVTGVWLNADTKEPLYLYVDTKKKDTIYGQTGAVVNGHVVESGDAYWYDADLEDEAYKDEAYKIKRGDDFKMEVEKDGDVTIKNGNKKTKIDGETGEKKVKYDN